MNVSFQFIDYLFISIIIVSALAFYSWEQLVCVCVCALSRWASRRYWITKSGVIYE